MSFLGAKCLFLALMILLVSSEKALNKEKNCSPRMDEEVVARLAVQRLEQLETKLNDLVAGRNKQCNRGTIAKRCPRNVTMVEMASGKYLLSNQYVTWFEALMACELLGLQLATPNTRQKDADFLKLMGDEGNVWIAGTDLGSEGSFYWVTTGEELGPYSDFIQIVEPNNAQYNEHCLHYWNNKLVNDIACDTKQRFICEESTAEDNSAVHKEQIIIAA